MLWVLMRIREVAFAQIKTVNDLDHVNSVQNVIPDFCKSEKLYVLAN